MRARLNWSFADTCERAQSVDEVQEIFMGEVRRLGFSYAACASHVDPLNPPAGAVMMFDYPRAWVEYYSTEGLAARDPVFFTARVQALPFRWSDPKFRRPLARDQIAILDAAAEAGLQDGLTIPIHAPNALPASCSLILGPDEIDPLSPRQAHWYAVYAHETVRRILLKLSAPRPRLLTKRERQCIELIARGKGDFEIGVILGLSQHTVHNTVRRIMRKYGVVSRIQMLARALRDREILIEDVAD